MIAEGKEVREFDGRKYILERSLRGDFAFVKAWKGDRWGNLDLSQDGAKFQSGDGDGGGLCDRRSGRTRRTRRAALRNRVHTPGIFVNAIFQGVNYEKRIEKRTVRKRA